MDPLTAPVETFDKVEVIRPAAVLESRVATLVLGALRADDVSTGGVWNASASVWQRWQVAAVMRGFCAA